MKNIHVLPTDKPSRIYLIKSNNKLGITSNNPVFTENFGSGTQNQHIYITSDEEIKEGDYAYYMAGFMIQKVKLGVNVSTLKAHKKIILTTDQDLIKDGVQAIPDEFLEWFVNNQKCERVQVEKAPYDGTKSIDKYWGGEYKIIIPKEETKQETIEEAAANYSGSEEHRMDFIAGAKWQEEKMKETIEEAAENSLYSKEHLNYSESIVFKQGCVFGAKWQEGRMYSEEEVINILVEFSAELKNVWNIIEWFKQFKKK